MRLMPIICVLMLLCLACLAAAAEPKLLKPAHSQTIVTLADGAPVTMLKAFDAEDISTSISLDKQEYKKGERLHVTTVITSLDGSAKVFNPFFNSDLELPGRLWVFDSNGKLVAEHFECVRFSRRGAGETDWISLHPHNFIGMRTDLELFFRGNSTPLLPPGEYKMQFVLTDTLLKGQKDAIIAPADKSQSTDDHSYPPFNIIAASEPVSFRIVSKQ